MKFLLPLRRGVKSAWHHLGLVFLLYLAALGGSLAAALVAFARYAEATGGSLFAQRAFADGNMFAIADDFARGHTGELAALGMLVPIFLLMTVIVHVLFAAGLTETLLERESKREHPFLLGIGRHGWRFVRSGLWFAILVGLGAVGVSVLFELLVADFATAQASSALQVWLGLGVFALAGLLYAFLDLGYDLSRISAAAHGEGRTLVGLFKGIGHAFRHPLLLLPLWLFFSLVVLGLHLGLTAFRNDWQPTSTGEVLGLIAVQQAVFLVAAFFRVGLWGAEVAYYQAVGEPRWCRKRQKKAKKPKGGEAAPTPPPVTVHRQPLPADQPAPGAEAQWAPEPPTTPEPVRPSWESAPLGDEEDEEEEGDGTGPRQV